MSDDYQKIILPEELEPISNLVDMLVMTAKNMT